MDAKTLRSREKKFTAWLQYSKELADDVPRPPHVLKNLVADNRVISPTFSGNILQIAVKGMDNGCVAPRLLKNGQGVAGLISSVIEEVLVRTMAGTGVQNQRSGSNFPGGGLHKFINTIARESIPGIIEPPHNSVQEIRQAFR